MHQKRPKDNGFTLPEVLISTGILGMVLLACYALVTFSLRWNMKMADSVHVYQQALNASTKISYDFGTGNRDSFVYDLEGFAFASARPPSGTFQLDTEDKLLYQKYVVYYIENGVLFRNERPIDPPASVLPITPELPDLKASLTTQGAVMAEGVSNLEIDIVESSMLKFTVTGKREDKNSITLQSRIAFRQ